MLTMQIGWPIATQPVIEHGSGQKSSFSTSWTWPFSTVTSFYLHVMGRKSLTDFQPTHIREMLVWAGHEPQPSIPVGRPAPASIHHNKHWPGHNPTKQWCCVCSARGVTWTVMSKCVKCDMALCVDWNIFADYHTNDNLWETFSSILHTNSWSLDHNVRKRTWIFTSILESIMQ